HRTVLSLNLLEGCLHTRLSADVHRQVEGAVALVHRGAGSRLGETVDRDHRGTLRQEGAHDLTADAALAAGHNGEFAVEPPAEGGHAALFRSARTMMSAASFAVWPTATPKAAAVSLTAEMMPSS